MTRSDAQLTLPRPLIFLASFWLMAAWAITIGLRPPVHPGSASYEPRVLMLLVSLVSGIGIAWPLYRFRWPGSGPIVPRTVLDLAVLAAMTQVVLWPTRLVTRWDTLRTALIDASLLAWLVIGGAVIAFGWIRSRTLAAAAAIVIHLFGPALVALRLVPEAAHDAVLNTSPWFMVHAMASAGPAMVTSRELLELSAVLAAGFLAWAVLIRLSRAPA